MHTICSVHVDRQAYRYIQDEQKIHGKTQQKVNPKLKTKILHKSRPSEARFPTYGFLKIKENSQSAHLELQRQALLKTHFRDRTVFRHVWPGRFTTTAYGAFLQRCWKTWHWDSLAVRTWWCSSTYSFLQFDSYGTACFLNTVQHDVACSSPLQHSWSDNKVRELIAVEVLHTSLLNTTVVAFKVLPFGSYAPMPAPTPPFKTNLELVLWNGLQNCRCIIPDVIKSSKCFLFNIPFIFGNRKKSLGARTGVQARCSNTVVCLVAKNSLTESAVWAGALSWCKIHELLAKISGRFRLSFSRSLSRTSKQ